MLARVTVTGLVLATVAASTQAITAVPAAAEVVAPPVATFSIVARDPDTGDLGIAVQSKFFAVGAVVPWARAGVGAVATQAFANTTFGPGGLALLEEDLAPEAVLDSLLASDEERDRRQVGLVDDQGRAISYTGTGCQSWAGHRFGAGHAVQGNILTGEEVVGAMERAYLDAPPGPLGGRLLAALEAGQAAGGDSRGKQSAALLVVRAGAGYGGFNDRYLDLRVDDHQQPIVELRRLYELWLPNALILEGYRLVDDGRFEEAVAVGESAIATDPDGPDGYYHTACYLARAGRGAEALSRLAEAIARDPKIASRAAGDPDFESVRSTERFKELTTIH
jgi:uncharacterized Ntn-hydrolase superfamily protein